MIIQYLWIERFQSPLGRLQQLDLYRQRSRIVSTAIATSRTVRHETNIVVLQTQGQDSSLHHCLQWVGHIRCSRILWQAHCKHSGCNVLAHRTAPRRGMHGFKGRETQQHVRKQKQKQKQHVASTTFATRIQLQPPLQTNARRTTTKNKQ